MSFTGKNFPSITVDAIDYLGDNFTLNIFEKAKAENKKVLKDCLTIWIQRDLELLETDGRPLSGNIEKLYKERENLYDEFADIIVENNSELEACVSEIKRTCMV